jgi:hypothetical protein
MTRAFIFCVMFVACKKHEPVQQAAPTEGPLVAPTVASVSAISDTATASASATPHEHTAAEIEAENQAEKRTAKLKALDEAREFGMLGLIGASDAGDAFGSGGLGLTGVGEGGGRGEGIGLGNIGTIGGGRFMAGDGGARHTPQVRQGTTTVNGRLPPEVIQRIVRQNFGRFRLCYENGLRSNPLLQGRVAVKYVIERDGSVRGTPTDGGSDMPDQNVVQCVMRAFQNLSYPQPEGGIVTVIFPLIFSPGT